MEKTFSIAVTTNYKITEQQIRDLLTTAFEGGINYWCQEVHILVNPKSSMFTADALINGGVLEFVDADDDTDKAERWTMTLNELLIGIKLEVETNAWGSVEDMLEDCDADVADNIIQYALFGKLVFC